MRNTKMLTKVLCIFLCIFLTFGLIMPPQAYAVSLDDVAHVVERGVSYLIIGICQGFVHFLIEPLGLSIDKMISQSGGNGDVGGLGKIEYGKGKTVTAVDLTTVRVIDYGGGEERVNVIFDAVIKDYYPLVYNIAIIVFLLVIIYIGLQTVMSTAAAKKEIYVGKLKAWAFGLFLLFAFNFVIVYVIKANNALATYFLAVGYDAKARAAAPDPAAVRAPAEASLDIMYYINKYRKDTSDSKGLYKYTVDGKEYNVTIYQSTDRKSRASYVDDYIAEDGTIRLIKDGNRDNPPKITSTTPMDTWKDLPSSAVYKVKFTAIMGDYNDVDRDVYFKAGTLYSFESGQLKLNDHDRSIDDVYKICEEGTQQPVTGGAPGKVVQDALNIHANQDWYTEAAALPSDPLLRTMYMEWRDWENKEGSVAYALVYFGGICLTIYMFFIYFTRMFMITFLILIFPVVMAVYAIDRLDDDSSKVFSEWWNHFIGYVFTNSIHALVLGLIIIILQDNNTPAFVQLIALCFIIPANKITRHIFGLNKGGGLDTGGIEAVAGMFAATKMLTGKFGGGAKSGGGSGGSSGGGSSDGDGGGSGGGSSGGGGGTLASNWHNKYINAKDSLDRFNASSNKAKAKTLGKAAFSASGSMLKAGGKMAGGLMGATGMAVTGQDPGKIMAAGFLGSEIGGGLAKTGTSLGAGIAAGAYYGAVSKAKFSNKKEMKADVYSDRTVFKDNNGKVLYEEERDNSKYTSTSAYKDDGTLNDADYSYTFSTDQYGNIMNNQMEMSAGNIKARVDAQYNDQSTLLEEQTKQLSYDYFGGNRDAFVDEKGAALDLSNKNGLALAKKKVKEQAKIDPAINADKAIADLDVLSSKLSNLNANKRTTTNRLNNQGTRIAGGMANKYFATSGTKERPNTKIYSAEYTS
ncbi:MAG: hypothetical protein ACM3KR_08260 [Deltaproteobacteria bacterium]